MRLYLSPPPLNGRYPLMSAADLFTFDPQVVGMVIAEGVLL